MTETQLFAELSKELRKRQWRCWKLHNDSMQRGFPDCALMKEHTQWAELKVAADAHAAWKELGKARNSKQYSVLRGMTEMTTTPLLVFVDTTVTGYQGGLIRLSEQPDYWHYDCVNLEGLIIRLSNEIIRLNTPGYIRQGDWHDLNVKWRD